MTKTDGITPMKGVNGYLRLRQYLSGPFPRRLLASCRAPAVRNLLRGLDRTLLRFYPPDIRLRHEFNRWAQKGSGARMALDHRWLAEMTVPEMSLASGDCVLDLGCGDGWASRLIAGRLGSIGRVVGIDVSDEMIRRARIRNSDLENVAFLCGSAERIPCRNELFTKVLSIEAFYYFEHQAAVLAELSRIVAPGGRLFLLVCIYKGLPDWRSSVRGLNVPVYACSADTYRLMLEAGGWGDVQTDELIRAGAAGSGTAHERALLIRARRP